MEETFDWMALWIFSIRLLGAVKTLNPCQRAQLSYPQYDNWGSNHLHLDNRTHTFALTLCPKTSPSTFKASFPHSSRPDRQGTAWSLYCPTNKGSLFVQLTHSDEAFSHKDRVTCKYWTSPCKNTNIVRISWVGVGGRSRFEDPGSKRIWGNESKSINTCHLGDCTCFSFEPLHPKFTVLNPLAKLPNLQNLFYN